mmetsp:Transcript_104626/g.272328  ORF Transcript_104626/g.272328 Transcript_104626/m.272328 type:complete len:458 (-) Transcript_104626:231-1604(-)
MTDDRPLASTVDRHLLSACVAASLHHLHELLEVDDSVAVAIDLLHHLCKRLCTGNILDFSVFQHEAQLLLGDLAVAVFVEQAERRPTNVLLHIGALVQRRCQELGVVDDATAVGVDVLEDGLQVLGDVLEACFRETLPHLGGGQQAVAVAVQLHEDIAQALDLVLIQLTRDDVEGSLLQLVLRAEAPQVVHKVALQGHARRLGSLVLDPLVVQGLLRSVAVTRVHLQEHADQNLGILRDVLPIRGIEGKIAQTHLRKHLGIGLAEEGRVAAEHDVHDHADAPHVAELVVLPGENLRGHIVGCASLRGQHLASLELAGQTEVDDLDQILLNGLLGHEQEVLGLQVAVAHVIFVHVVERPDDLLHEDGGLDLREVPRLDDAVEELAARGELHDQINVAVVLEGLVEFDDVGVVHHFHDGDLLLEAVDVLHLRLGDGLAGPNGARGLVLRLGHGAIGALP